MNKLTFVVALLASFLAIAGPVAAAGNVNPATLAQQDLAAESRGDIAAALALYSDDAIIQGGGLCAAAPCVGKAAIQQELERRVAAKNHATIVGKYVSGNVAVVKAEVKIGFIEWTGVDHVVVWTLYEVKDGKIAVATLIGQRTDPQTARFIQICCSKPR